MHMLWLRDAERQMNQLTPDNILIRAYLKAKTLSDLRTTHLTVTYIRSVPDISGIVSHTCFREQGNIYIDDNIK